MAGDAMATKIIELSKKNRVLTAESEGVKARLKQQNHHIQELEQEVRGLPLGGGTPSARAPPQDRGR